MNIIHGEGVHVFAVMKPLFCPYYNIWGRVEYWRMDAFSHDPFTVKASSTSGSPIVIDAHGKFFGFMNDAAVADARFEFDGDAALTVKVPEGQLLAVDENGNRHAWREYNTEVMATLSNYGRTAYPSFWDDIEYCTWVEQKYFTKPPHSPHDVLDHEFVVSYLKELSAFGFPKGKFTIDHGWAPHPITYGDYMPDEKKFPDLARTAGLIREAGYTPGIHLAPMWIHPESEFGKAHPECIGDAASAATADTGAEKKRSAYYYLKPGSPFEENFRSIILRLHAMGFMKFKLDMSYHDKEYMKALHKVFYHVIKSVDETIEVEIHQPDIFFAQYGDVIRTNDVLCNDAYDWRRLAKAHFSVCCRSAPTKIINLDHIGGNDPFINESTFIEHLRLYRHETGHPVVSLLPHHAGKGAVETLGDYLDAYVAIRRSRSDYYVHEVE